MGKNEKGFALWLTGLSGSGKTTIAGYLSGILSKRVFRPEVLDGDVVRKYLCSDLGFTKEDRLTNIRRVVFIVKLLTRNNIPVIASFISPYSELRSYCRSEIENYIEIYVKCPLDVLIERDPKGLYQKALQGEILNFTGVSAPYEEPVDPELIVETGSETAGESVEKIINWLEEKGYIPPDKK